MKHKQKSNYKSKEKFWSGSGKFLLSIITIYLIILGINVLIRHSENQCESFSPADIQIAGNKLIPDKQILHLCGFKNREERKKLKIDIQKLAKNIMSLDYVKGVSITKRLPRILNITIEERKPVAFIYGRGLNLIDTHGFLLPVPDYVKSWDLPLISGIKNLGELGDSTISNKVYIALELISYLEQENPLLAGMVSEINLAPDKYIELFLIKGGTRVRINDMSFYKEIYALKNFIIKYVNIAELSHIEYIDLRFRDQLIIKQKT
jgi:cell division septal protein FtsQ